MASRKNGLGEDEVQRAREAAARWRDRAGFREQRAAFFHEKRYAKVDTAPRLAARAQRLDQWRVALGRTIDEADGSLESTLPEVERRALRPTDVTEAAIERVISNRDLMSIEFFEIGLDAARAVGRVTTNGATNGTGFLVGNNLLMTNNHVLPSADFAAISQLELDVEEARFGLSKRMEVFDLLPDRFFMTDETLDFTLVAVATASSNGVSLSGYGFKPLISTEGKVAVTEAVNIIQHPGSEPKRVVIRNNQLVDVFADQPDKPFFHYLADTEKGSSGSPVFNDQWELVALHHQSVPKTNAKGQLVDRTGRIIKDGDDPSRIEWIANEGIRVSHLVRHISGAHDLTAEMLTIRDAVLRCWQVSSMPAAQLQAVADRKDAGKETASSEVRRTWSDRAAPSVRNTLADLRPKEAGPGPMRRDPSRAATSTQGVSFSVPLRITLGLGELDENARRESAGAFSTPGSALAGLAQERVEPASDYDRRPGFLANFLGFPAPMPKLTEDRYGPLAILSTSRTSELRYHHYSVLMNERRRLAYVAAVNIDMAAHFRHEREQGADAWYFDPRLPKHAQAGTSYYAGNPLDRGHLVRRDDAAWGQTAEEAKLSNDDTFHWTNCSPQHEIFNQSGKASQQGLQLWGNLELAVSRLAGRLGNRLCVFNGPVFADDDRPYGQGFWLPKEFWKLIVVLDEAGRPRALAFLLSQATQIADLAREGFAPEELAPFRAAQIALSELERITFLRFEELAGFDALTESSDPREAAGAAMILMSEGDIRI